MIDIIFAILIIIASYKGYQKGLIIALFSIIAFIIGLAAALKLSAFVAEYLSNSISISAKWMPFISFILVFIGVALLVRIGGKLIEKTFQMALLGWSNRLGGIILYTILYTIIYSIILFYAEKIQLINTAAIEASQTYSFIQPWGPKAINGFGEIVPIFKDMFTSLTDFFASIPPKNS